MLGHHWTIADLLLYHLPMWQRVTAIPRLDWQRTRLDKARRKCLDCLYWLAPAKNVGQGKRSDTRSIESPVRLSLFSPQAQETAAARFPFLPPENGSHSKQRKMVPSVQ